MTISAEHERPRAGDHPPPGFADTVTFAFGDRAAELYGIARVGLTSAGASGLAVLFRGRESVAASAQGAIAVTEPTWEAARAGGVRSTVQEPLRAWTVAYEDDGAGFDLRFEARSLPAALGAGDPAAAAVGMEGYEQLCSVSGTVRTPGGGERAVRCLGQRGHLWGTPDWERIELARTVSAWLGPDAGVTLTAVRPAGAQSHLDEAVGAWLFCGPSDAREAAVAVPVAEPRVSTTYDAQSRQRRASLELWCHDEDDFPRRAAGEVLCGTSLDLGRLRLDASFFAWRMEGRTGVGRYDVLRRA